MAEPANSIKLQNGLIEIGGILTETYYRQSLASQEARKELGLEGEANLQASIGIASIEEFVTMNAYNINTDRAGQFNLSQFDQPMKLKSLYVENNAQDKLRLTAYLPTSNDPAQPGYFPLITQVFGRNHTPIMFPDAPLPANTIIMLTSDVLITFAQLCFQPCSILKSVEATYAPDENPVLA